MLDFELENQYGRESSTSSNSSVGIRTHADEEMLEDIAIGSRRLQRLTSGKAKSQNGIC